MSAQPFIVSLLIAAIGIVVSTVVVADFKKDAGDRRHLGQTGEDVVRRFAKDVDVAQSVGAVVALATLLFDPELAPNLSTPLAAAAAVLVSIVAYFGLRLVHSDTYFNWTVKMHGVTPFGAALVAMNLLALFAVWLLRH